MAPDGPNRGRFQSPDGSFASVLSLSCGSGVVHVSRHHRPRTQTDALSPCPFLSWGSQAAKSGLVGPAFRVDLAQPLTRRLGYSPGPGGSLPQYAVPAPADPYPGSQRRVSSRRVSWMCGLAMRSDVRAAGALAESTRQLVVATNTFYRYLARCQSPGGRSRC